MHGRADRARAQSAGGRGAERRLGGERRFGKRRVRGSFGLGVSHGEPAVEPGNANHAVLDPERCRHGHAQSGGGRAVRERRRFVGGARKRKPRDRLFSRRRREKRREKVSPRESPLSPFEARGDTCLLRRDAAYARGKFHRVVPSLEADAKELGSAVKKEGAISSPPRVSFVWGTCDAQPRSEAWCAPPTFDARRVAAVCGVEYDEPKSVSPVSPERLSIVSRSSPSSSSSLGADAKEPKGETSANANERERERERPKKTDATAGTDDEPRDFRRLSANRAPSGRLLFEASGRGLFVERQKRQKRQERTSLDDAARPRRRRNRRRVRSRRRARRRAAASPFEI